MKQFNIIRDDGTSDLIRIDEFDKEFLSQAGFFKLLEHQAHRHDFQGFPQAITLTPFKRSILFHATHIAYTLYLDDGGLYKHRSFEELLWLFSPAGPAGDKKNFAFTHMNITLDQNEAKDIATIEENK